MGERITVVGGTDSAIAVTLDGSQAVKLANEFAKDLRGYYVNNDKLNFMAVTANPDVIEDKLGYGIITQGGSYSAGNGYDYIVAGGYNYTKNPIYLGQDGETDESVNPSTAELLNQDVTINSIMNANQTVNILAGNTGGFTYNAGEESGQFAGGSAENNVLFQGNTVNGGTWTIAVGNGNNTINAGSGINTIYSGDSTEAAGSRGHSVIDITNGIANTVRSEGKDTITALDGSTAVNNVVLSGGSSQYATVNLSNDNAVVTDMSYYNSVTVGGGSTINGGNDGNYAFTASDDDLQGTFTNGVSSTINAASDLTVVHGNDNTITGSQHVTLLNGVGNTAMTASGRSVVFGADGLNLTLDATGDDSALYVANVGNATLDASGSTAGIAIYGNSAVDGNQNLVAKGGSGNDELNAGAGNSTFTGGTGDNLFVFNKASDTDGKTVITDFNREGSSNKIFLYDYGLDNDSLQALLDSSKDDANGNAVLNLSNHTITVEGVHASDLTVNQFMLGGDSK